jgi:hypothetical protein
VRIVQLMAPPNPMVGQESRDTNEVDQLTGEKRSLVQTVLQTHLVIPKKYIIQIFKSSFNPINLPRIHRSGADLADKSDKVQLSTSGHMSMKKAKGSFKDFSVNLQVWSDSVLGIKGAHYIGSVQPPQGIRENNKRAENGSNSCSCRIAGDMPDIRWGNRPEE